MPRYEFSSPRLYVAGPLTAGDVIALDRAQANYLVNVLRLGAGARVLAFDGASGEFAASLAVAGKSASLRLIDKTREQPPLPPVRLLFAPLKHARLDYLVQKAVEMGAGSIEPVITRRTQVTRVNLERMRANVIEAAEQCGVLAVPPVLPERALDKAIASLEPGSRLIVCDEDAPVTDPLAALGEAAAGTPVAIVIGPEGGFDETERAMLVAMPGAIRLSLGPRILRADTAAVAALALVQATLGDWRG